MNQIIIFLNMVAIIYFVLFGMFLLALTIPENRGFKLAVGPVIAWCFSAIWLIAWIIA
jgi:hypothetical protein